MEAKVSDRRLDEARARLERVDQGALLSGDAEAAKQSTESVQEAKKLLSQIRADNRPELLQQELDAVVENFNEDIRVLAESTEEVQFDNLARSAQRAILEGSDEAEERISDLRSKVFQILWRQDWFIQDWFERLVAQPWLFEDQEQFQSLVAEGHLALESGGRSRLRGVVWQLNSLKFGSSEETDAADAANIIYRRH